MTVGEELRRIEREAEERGQALYAELTDRLIDADRISDFKRAKDDLGFRQKLFEEFGLSAGGSK